MADTTINPLPQGQPLVNSDGTPTMFFQRWAQERSIDIGNSITEAEAQALIDAWAAAREIIAGTGLSGGGPLSSNVTLNLDASIGQLTDVDTTTTPPTDGQALAWDESVSKWVPETIEGGGGTGAAALPHLYWRLRWDDNAQGNYGYAITEVGFCSTIGGPTVTTGGTPFALNDDGSNHAANAFDGSDSTYYGTATFGGQYPPTEAQYTIGYEFSAPTIVEQFTLKATPGAAPSINQMPLLVHLEFSDDGDIYYPAGAYSVLNPGAGYTSLQKRLFTNTAALGITGPEGPQGPPGPDGPTLDDIMARISLGF